MIVGVMASGDESLAKKHEASAKEVGGTVAELGFHLLTGGGDGLMKIVGREFLNTKQRTGKSISILRAKDTTHLTSEWNKEGELKELRKARETKRSWKPRKDNKLGEIVIRTHLPYSGKLGLHDLSRNHINALTSDLVVVLPGGPGSLSELQLAWEYDKEIMLYLGKNGTVDGQTPKQLKQQFLWQQRLSLATTKLKLKTWLQQRGP
jgi:predicted Rossmann-fold nucleotide-binding protein